MSLQRLAFRKGNANVPGLGSALQERELPVAIGVSRVLIIQRLFLSFTSNN
jgi:hypothetical protein